MVLALHAEHPSAQPDPELVHLVVLARLGSRDAFAQLWQHHAHGVRAILRAMAPRHEAEDLAQDVVLAALLAIGELRRPERFSSWLNVIARNVARRALSRRGLQPLSFAELDQHRAPMLGANDAFDVVDQVRLLPRRYHRPLLLRLLMEMTGPEIAAQTGMTHGSVRVNLHHGFRLLRQRLQPHLV